MSSVFPPNISNFSKKETLEFLRDNLSRRKEQPIFLVTLNPEIALLGVKDKRYAEILSKSLAVVDGFGIKLLAVITGKRVGERIAGVELIKEIIKLAVIYKLKITAVVREDGFSSKDEVERMFKEKFSLADVSVVTCKQKERVCEIDTETQLLIVGLGAPYQEKFIYNVLPELKNLRLAVGAGGTFDFWTGKKKRAPKFFRKYGMEWFWRFVIQPNRARRIWNALVVFPYYAIKYSLR